MKKLLSLMLALILVLGMAAFAESGQPNFNIYAVDNAYFTVEREQMEKSFATLSEELGFDYSFHYTLYDLDPEKAMTQVQTAIADKADILIFCCADDTMAISIGQLCREAGIPLVASDNPMYDENGESVAAWFGIDAYNIGYAAGEWMAAYAQEVGAIDDPAFGLIYSTNEASASTSPRTAGEKQAWADILGDAMADRTFEADSDGSQDAYYNSCAAVIAAHPEITSWLVMTVSETGAIACAAALEDAMLAETSCINCVGGDEVPDHWANNNYSEIKACTYFSGKTIAKAMVEAVVDYLVNGTEIPMHNAVPAVMMDPTNYQEVIG